MIIKKAELETVCGVTSTFPQNDHPEFAFAGKSNVGKSSLINGLLNRKALAVPLPSRVRPRRLIFIILMTNSISWICRDMAMPK